MLTLITSDTFGQLRYIIDQMDTSSYAQKHEILGGSSIGQHVRHVIEFYTCLAEGIKHGIVDYDQRKRNIQIESDPEYAQSVLTDLMGIFCCQQMDDVSLSNAIEYNGTRFLTKSSLSRELVYLIEHSIHHYAIIKIALNHSYENIDIPVGFGVAYSTTKHHEKMLELSGH